MIVYVFPHYFSIPSMGIDSFATLCWSELLLYKHFQKILEDSIHVFPHYFAIPSMDANSYVSLYYKFHILSFAFHLISIQILCKRIYLFYD